MNRRGFLLGLGSGLVAAPSIVRAASLMPVRGIVMPVVPRVITPLYGGHRRYFVMISPSIYRDLAAEVDWQAVT